MQIKAAEWNQLIDPKNDLAMDQRVLHVMENTLADQAKFWTVVFRDQNSKIIACAVLCLFAVDIMQSGFSFFQKWVNKIRLIWPTLFKGKVLFCGLPIPSGNSHLRFQPDLDPKPILILLNQVMQDLAKQNQAQLIALKEFNTVQAEQISSLRDLGFYQGELDPLFVLSESFTNFDNYVAALRSMYRRQVLMSVKKFNLPDLKVEHILDSREISLRFTDEVYQLYLNTWERAKEKLERLSPQFFRELALAMPSQVILLLISKADKPVAFSINLIDEKNYCNLYIGLDYQLRDELDLYFNLFYHELDVAFSLKKKHIYLGQTSNDFKLRLGAIPDPRFFYVRGQNPIIKLGLRLFHSFIFPKVPPLKSKNVFKK